MKTSLKIYVTAAVLASGGLAYAQTPDTATTPSSTSAAATTPSSTPDATPSSTPTAAAPATSGETQDEAAATRTTEDGDDNMADDDTSLAPRSDRN